MGNTSEFIVPTIHDIESKKKKEFKELMSED